MYHQGHSFVQNVLSFLVRLHVASLLLKFASNFKDKILQLGPSKTLTIVSKDHILVDIMLNGKNWSFCCNTKYFSVILTWKEFLNSELIIRFYDANSVLTVNFIKCICELFPHLFLNISFSNMFIPVYVSKSLHVGDGFYDGYTCLSSISIWKLV